LTNRRGVIAALIINDADEMQAFEMIGRDLENASIRRLRFGQAIAMMERERLAEDRHRLVFSRANWRGLLPTSGRPRCAVGAVLVLHGQISTDRPTFG
jgi:hypothetical protein